MKNIIGYRVHLARLNCRPPLTQEALAARLQLNGWNISRTGVAKIEVGLRQVTDIEIVKLAETLNVSVSWLFGADE